MNNKKSLKEFEKAYLSGFLDADGSVYVRAKKNSSYKYGFQIAPYIVFYQSCKSYNEFNNVIKIIGVGKTRKRKDGMLEHVVQRIEEINYLLNILNPYVIMKKKQIALMIKILNKKEKVKSKKDFKKLLQLVDEFRKLNYSKKRKIRTLAP